MNYIFGVYFARVSIIGNFVDGLMGVQRTTTNDKSKKLIKPMYLTYGLTMGYSNGNNGIQRRHYGAASKPDCHNSDLLKRFVTTAQYHITCKVYFSLTMNDCNLSCMGVVGLYSTRLHKNDLAENNHNSMLFLNPNSCGV